MDFAEPFIQYPSPEEKKINQLIREQAELYDSAPLFLPTSWNYVTNVETLSLEVHSSSLFPTYEEKWTISDEAADFVYIGKGQVNFELPGTPYIIQDGNTWQKKDQNFPLFSLDDYLKYTGLDSAINFVCISLSDCFRPELYTLNNKQSIVLVIDTNNNHGVAEQRRAFFEIININWNVPIIIRRNYNAITKDEFQLFSATDLGSLLIDGFGDGIWLIADKPINLITHTCFGILQATRTRISKTEYISCPSCGRTLFCLLYTSPSPRDS